jgi:ABC-type branched-subunit amino acid transport system ATPase component
VGLLDIERLSAGYGKLVVLHELSLSVEAGQFVTVLGPNGSGKSTLVKSVFGLTDVFGGEARFVGKSLLGLPTEAVGRRGLAYVPQRGNVFASLTVRDNLSLALRRRPRSEGEEALGEAYTMFPILSDRSGQRAGQLSGGERQMLAIALAWLSRPRLMLLDEPSAGLAPTYVTGIFRLLRQLCESGITLLVVEQNARSVLRWCDYGYVLREGQVVFQGTAASILADEETVKDYLGIGFKPL